MKKKSLKQNIFTLLLVTGCIGLAWIGCAKKSGETVTTPGDFNQELLNLVLTEIHYNPSDYDAYPSDSLEFIEIKNIGTSTLQLATLEVSGDVTYMFPEDASVGPGEFYIIASNATAFQARYGTAPDGVYIGVLDNSDGNIILRDVTFQEVIFTQFYADSGAWSGKADGDGYSLVTTETNPDRQLTGPEVWKRSACLYGSPGADDVSYPVDSSLFYVKISEIHYHPLDYESIDGDSLEFIELKNVGTASVDLSHLAFTNGIDYTFPSGSALEAGQIIVLASDITTFSKRYTSVTPFGQFSGHLSNTGEKVTLFDVVADVKITSVDYKDGGSWPSEADGDGASLVALNPTYGVDQDSPTQWRMSFRPDGSPGTDDQGIVIINEVLTHTDAPQLDAIELYNPGTADVDISGWYISDSKASPAKYKIPDGTIIPAGGYRVFDERHFNADTTNAYAFTFNSHGESAWIFSNELGCGEGYCDGIRFGELDNFVSIGRYLTSNGKVTFTRMQVVTLGDVNTDPRIGAENSGPRIGPLVISEIMYHSTDNAGDYVEVTNITPNAIALSHPEHPDFTWKVGGASFSFPQGTTIGPNESVVVASDSLSVDAFRTRYSMAAEIQVFQMTGNLDNSSEKIEILQPADPFVEDSTVSDSLTYPYVTIDLVDYSDQKPWPIEPDGTGQVLQRISLEAFGDDVANWKAAAPTPGTPAATE